MKDGSYIKCMSIGGSVVIVCVMLALDGMTAQIAASGVLAALTGVGGAAIVASRRQTL
jgi:hypothetical protein